MRHHWSPRLLSTLILASGVLLAVPLMLPMLMSPVLGIALTPLWTMSAWFLLPIVLLAPPEVRVARLNAVRLAFLILCYSLTALAASPAIAWIRFAHENPRPTRAHYAAVSEELTRAWRQATKRPLRIVAGQFDLAHAVTFYSPDHPAWMGSSPQMTPWITEEHRSRDGWAAICAAIADTCEGAIMHETEKAAGVIRIEYELATSFLGWRGPPAKYVFVLVPPR